MENEQTNAPVNDAPVNDAPIMASTTIADPATSVAFDVWPSVKIPLRYAIDWLGEKDLKMLELREPDAEALEAIDLVGMEEGKPLTMKQIRQIASALSGVSADALKKLHFKDLRAVSNEIGPFLARLASED